MSGPTTPGTPPPEVPEEFAAAYTAAYEQALAAQRDEVWHGVDPEPVDDGAPTVLEEIRRSGWFVPVLLVLLLLLLVFGAYAVGRHFTGQVDGGSSSHGQVIVNEVWLGQAFSARGSS